MREVPGSFLARFSLEKIINPCCCQGRNAAYAFWTFDWELVYRCDILLLFPQKSTTYVNVCSKYNNQEMKKSTTQHNISNQAPLLTLNNCFPPTHLLLKDALIFSSSICCLWLFLELVIFCLFTFSLVGRGKRLVVRPTSNDKRQNLKMFKNER